MLVLCQKKRHIWLNFINIYKKIDDNIHVFVVSVKLHGEKTYKYFYWILIIVMF